MQASQAELKALTQVFADRDIAIRKGLIFEGKRFEVSNPHTMHRNIGSNAIYINDMVHLIKAGW